MIGLNCNLGWSTGVWQCSWVFFALGGTCVLACCTYVAQNTCAVSRLVAQSFLTFCNPMDCSPPGSSVHEDSPGKKSGVGCHALLQWVFPTRASKPVLLHCRWVLYHLSLKNLGGAKGEMCVFSTGMHKRAVAGHTKTGQLLPALKGDEFSLSFYQFWRKKEGSKSGS